MKVVLWIVQGVLAALFLGGRSDQGNPGREKLLKQGSDEVVMG